MDQLVEKLRAALGHNSLLAEPEELLVYECDGLPHHKYRPRAVVFPNSTEETSEVMRLLAEAQAPFTPRGAGTGLSGGALALNNGVVIEMARMRRVLGIDYKNRLAVVQTGVVNAHVSRAVAHLGLHYVPDPSSQPTCTIGGNIAENAGGIHCLKYGTTTDHIIGARVVLAGGEIVDLKSTEVLNNGYDLMGTFVGSEGTFGIATEATLRLTPIPPAIRTLLADFVEVDDASHAVSAIIAAGVMPAALEMMDREIIRAVEASVFAAGLPPDAGAALLIELDGLEAGLDEEADRVVSICLENRARTCRRARDENERKKLWAARKGAFGAIGRIAPDSMIQDAVVPRSRLPEVLSEAYRIASKYQLMIANVFHAGDGNLHPLICFDSRSSEEVRRVKEAGRELMEVCVRAGGSITGEHGVGLDKREYFPLIFSEADMETMLRVREAFDPLRLCNPGKILPAPRGCGEARAVVGEAKTFREGEAGSIDVSEAIAENVGAQSTLSWRAESPHPSVSVTSGSSVASITPRSIEEAIDIVKRASESDLTITPVGAQTWCRSQNEAIETDLIISTERLTNLIEHEPADLIATTQTGLTLDEFNRQLALRGQWLPVDPPNDGRATIGGVIATGIGGAQVCGYGPIRKYVIGMKLVRPDGKLIKVGGKVVKNVAGYDLCKLFTGSYGTLGLILEVTFKLRPRPEKEATLIASGSVEGLVTVGHSILNEPLFPVALELLSPAVAGSVIDTKPNNCVLMVRFAGSKTTVGHQLNRAVTLMRREGNGLRDEIHEEDQTLWQKLRALPLLSQEIGWRTVIKPSEIAEFILSFNEESMWSTGVANGEVRGYGPEYPQEISRFTVLDNRSRELMRRIKGQLDPKGVFPSSF